MGKENVIAKYMDYNKFQILEFNLENMVANPAIVMIAKRGSGKSWITREILYHYRKIPGGTIISPTDRMDPFYKFFFPDLFIHHDISIVILQKLLARQTIMLEKKKQKKKKGLKVDPSCILVMDDCLSKKKSWANDDTINQILMDGRHYSLTYILTMQTPLGLLPDLRLNFDYVFLLKEDSALNIKKLYINYASVFDNVNDFKKVFSECTKDFCAMVIDNRKPADNICDKVFWFKAKMRKFSFGCNQFKEIHKKYYNPNFMRERNKEIINGRVFGGRQADPGDIRVERVERI
jgi:hypothetical protein